eukprot:gnl/TRDRNA2_/TRDRNA2_157582_c0_seq1.p1 gnl/TRDRNA2_/TRDRNA2_157582_c0~~gnl/TRDRNA2_/TRDRNA2_157582_c0_seq1.p1  ORF type:complete len:212 (+),score=8.91 gnl/TRDRNA2_/TRDRNA2_157582_c0_seq1:61-696(+)
MGNPAMCPCVRRDIHDYQARAYTSGATMSPASSGLRPRVPGEEQRSAQSDWDSRQGFPPPKGHYGGHLNGTAGSYGLNTGSCIICNQADANTVCLPCGHLLICYRCSLRYQLPDGSGLHPDVRCPRCKQSVKQFQRILTQAPDLLHAGYDGHSGRGLPRSVSMGYVEQSYESRELAPSSRSFHGGQGHGSPEVRPGSRSLRSSASSRSFHG